MDKYAVFQSGFGQYVGSPIHIELVPGACSRFFKCRQVLFTLVDRVKEKTERLDRRGIPGVKPYLDDILVTAPSEGEHDKRLDRIFNVTKEGIHATEGKLKAIKEAPPPRDKKQLQAFLGLLNFYSAFMPKKATVLEPLHRFLDATTKSNCCCSKKEHKAFEAAKELLTAKSVLAHFDGTKPLLLACDSSEHGLGAILSQIEEGQEKAVAYACRTMFKTVPNYGQIDKEALALMFGVQKFHQYHFGRHFTAVTDHKPLLDLLGTKKPTSPVMST
uniref:RNA-directed DNA polymerase n=1 Tax=Trichuris muris TaxID=70415 RepID=A0A5S6QXP6_TRIMR